MLADVVVFKAEVARCLTRIQTEINQVQGSLKKIKEYANINRRECAMSLCSKMGLKHQLRSRSENNAKVRHLKYQLDRIVAR